MSHKYASRGTLDGTPCDILDGILDGTLSVTEDDTLNEKVDDTWDTQEALHKFLCALRVSTDLTAFKIR